MLRKKCRTQSLWNLHLAGDWHVGSETMPLGASSHMMRVMLISNLAVDQVTFIALRPPSLSHIREEPHALQRFANGTQGRLLQWHPAANESKRRALPAYCPDLLARFCKAGRSRGAHSWCRRHGGVEIRSGVRLIFPSFVAGDPTSVFLPESRRPRCPRGR